MRRNVKQWLAAVVVAVSSLPGVALAHAGRHESAQDGGLLHALTHVDHLLVIATVGVGIVLTSMLYGATAARFRRKHQVRD